MLNKGTDLKPDRSHLTGEPGPGEERQSEGTASLAVPASCQQFESMVLGAHRQRGWGGRRMIHRTVWEGR